MERITADVGAMDDESIQSRIAKLKSYYDKGLISQATYYENQCSIVRELRKRGCPMPKESNGAGSDRTDSYSRMLDSLIKDLKVTPRKG